MSKRDLRLGHSVADGNGNREDCCDMPQHRRPITETILAGPRDQDDANWHRACLWADYAPRLFDACSAAYIAYQRRKMDPSGLKDAMALCQEIASKLAHEVWENGPWSLKVAHERSLSQPAAQAPALRVAPVRRAAQG